MSTLSSFLLEASDLCSYWISILSLLHQKNSSSGLKNLVIISENIIQLKRGKWVNRKTAQRSKPFCQFSFRFVNIGAKNCAKQTNCYENEEKFPIWLWHNFDNRIKYQWRKYHIMVTLLWREFCVTMMILWFSYDVKMPNLCLFSGS